MSPRLEYSKRIAEIYSHGGNIIRFLRSLDGRKENTVEDILISYDFQAGSYIREYEANPVYLDAYTSEIQSLFGSLGDFQSCLEAGCGEATTLAVLSRKLPAHVCMGGFDIAWSRIKLGLDFARRMSVPASLFCADLFQIPLEDKSVDVVYTSHSIEPNGGREAEAICELSRIARKWVVLLEPAYDLASSEARDRMEHHGYARNLAQTIRKLGLDLVKHELFPISANALNPTGLYLIKIAGDAISCDSFRYRCPVTKSPLLACEGAYYSPDSLLAYPVLAGVPYLLGSHAILATKFQLSVCPGIPK